MGRLEDIVERNKYPRRHRKGSGLTIGVGLALFVFIVIVLMVFTDLGMPKHTSPPPPDPSAPKRVRGIELRSAPARVPRDAAVMPPSD